MYLEESQIYGYHYQFPFQVDIFQFCVRCEKCKVFVILQYIVLLQNLEILVIHLTSKNLSNLSLDLKYLESALVDANQHLLNLEQSKCVPMGRWLESKMTDLKFWILWFFDRLEIVLQLFEVVILWYRFANMKFQSAQLGKISPGLNRKIKFHPG